MVVVDQVGPDQWDGDLLVEGLPDLPLGDVYGFYVTQFSPLHAVKANKALAVDFPLHHGVVLPGCA